ncbi:uncharacterized protein LOC118189264 [Stegodyphus dumicola]|uniref:uncharacterized protein LOC118189264 n=1 Tax=Stegodyphus dumicola TaxID=202533 RepID=UPI0015AC9185|nr:uncharacterized protein LOC118189264 [Stegodyphus dumicola]
MIFYIILITVAAGLSAAQENPLKCSGLEFVTCAFLVDQDKVGGTGMEENEELLDRKCEKAKPILKCLNDFAENCPTTSLNHIMQFFKDQYATISKICDKNDDLRKRYLANAKCLNKHRGKTESKCGVLLEFDEAERLTKEHCVSQERTFKCTFEESQTTCGKQAFSLLNEILSPVTKLLKTICSDFQFLHLNMLPQFQSMSFALY